MKGNLNFSTFKNKISNILRHINVKVKKFFKDYVFYEKQCTKPDSDMIYLKVKVGLLLGILFSLSKATDHSDKKMYCSLIINYLQSVSFVMKDPAYKIYISDILEFCENIVDPTMRSAVQVNWT